MYIYLRDQEVLSTVQYEVTYPNTLELGGNWIQSRIIPFNAQQNIITWGV